MQKFTFVRVHELMNIGTVGEETGVEGGLSPTIFFSLIQFGQVLRKGISLFLCIMKTPALITASRIFSMSTPWRAEVWFNCRNKLDSRVVFFSKMVLFYIRILAVRLDSLEESWGPPQAVTSWPTQDSSLSNNYQGMKQWGIVERPSPSSFKCMNVIS